MLFSCKLPIITYTRNENYVLKKWLLKNEMKKHFSFYYVKTHFDTNYSTYRGFPDQHNLCSLRKNRTISSIEHKFSVEQR